jgi:hypothetical protein
VVTFPEFMQIMSQLRGEGPEEVRRQGMALATLAVAGNEDLADRILDRAEEMTTEEQQFFQATLAVTGDKNLADRIMERSEEMTTLPKLIPAELVREEHTPTTELLPFGAGTKLMDLRASDFADCRAISTNDGAYYLSLHDAVRKVTGQLKTSVRNQLSNLDSDTHR